MLIRPYFKKLYYVLLLDHSQLLDAGMIVCDSLTELSWWDLSCWALNGRQSVLYDHKPVSGYQSHKRWRLFQLEVLLLCVFSCLLQMCITEAPPIQPLKIIVDIGVTIVRTVPTDCRVPCCKTHNRWQAIYFRELICVKKHLMSCFEIKGRRDVLLALLRIKSTRSFTNTKVFVSCKLFKQQLSQSFDRIRYARTYTLPDAVA